MRVPVYEDMNEGVEYDERPVAEHAGLHSHPEHEHHNGVVPRLHELHKLPESNKH